MSNTLDANDHLLNAGVVEQANLFRIGDEVEIVRAGKGSRVDWTGSNAEVRGVMVDQNGRVNIGLRSEVMQFDGAFAPSDLRLLKRR